MQAFTSKSLPRYFPMVLAFAGDSTMTRLCFAIVTSKRPGSGACLFRQIHRAGVPLPAVLCHQMLDLQHGQGRQHPPGGDAPSARSGRPPAWAPPSASGAGRSGRRSGSGHCGTGSPTEPPAWAPSSVGPDSPAPAGVVLRPLPAQLVREPGLVFPQDVPGVGRQPGAVPDQAVAAHAGRSVNGSGDGEHVPPLLQGGARRDERTAALRRLHHQGCPGRGRI